MCNFKLCPPPPQSKKSFLHLYAVHHSRVCKLVQFHMLLCWVQIHLTAVEVHKNYSLMYIHILLSDITAAIVGGVVAVAVVVAATVIVMVVTAFVAKRRTARFSVHQDAG